jgi:hypothetical protein
MTARLAPQWAVARTLADLGELVAQWLEGSIPTQPGYHGGPDEETAPLVPTLAAADRAGYVTYSSQPGFDGPGYNGERWQQRAAVEGLVADEQVAARLVRAAEGAGLRAAALPASRWRCRQATAATVTRSGWPGSVTWLPRTGFGVQLSRRELASMYDGCSRDAVRAVQAAWQVTLVDPQWGPGDRLWDLLDGWAR